MCYSGTWVSNSNVRYSITAEESSNDGSTIWYNCVMTEVSDSGDNGGGGDIPDDITDCSIDPT